MLFIDSQKCATLTIMGSQIGGLEIQKIPAKNKDVVNLSCLEAPMADSYGIKHAPSIRHREIWASQSSIGTNSKVFDVFWFNIRTFSSFQWLKKNHTSNKKTGSQSHISETLPSFFPLVKKTSFFFWGGGELTNPGTSTF